MSILYHSRVLSLWGYGKPLFYVSALSSMMNLKCVRKPRFTHATKQKNVWILPNLAIAGMEIAASSSMLNPKSSDKPGIEKGHEATVLPPTVINKINLTLAKNIEKTFSCSSTMALIFFARRSSFISATCTLSIQDYGNRRWMRDGRIYWRKEDLEKREYTLCDLIIASKIKFHYENKYMSFVVVGLLCYSPTSKICLFVKIIDKKPNRVSFNV